jgi:hypothetical protein
LNSELHIFGLFNQRDEASRWPAPRYGTVRRPNRGHQHPGLLVGAINPLVGSVETVDADVVPISTTSRRHRHWWQVTASGCSGRRSDRPPPRHNAAISHSVGTLGEPCLQPCEPCLQ